MEDDTPIGRVAVMAMPIKIAAAHVQLHVSSEQAARRAYQCIAEVGAATTAGPPAVDHAQPLSLGGDQRLGRKRLAEPKP